MWFKSKLQNPDPEVRRQHLEHLEPQDEMLIEIARKDPHPDVRASALTRIVDLNTLKELARDDKDERIRKQATARLQTLLAGAEGDELTLDNRVEFLKTTPDGHLIRYLVRSANEPELRKLALSQLLQNKNEPNVQDLLCDVAAEDPVQEIRQAAAEPVQDAKRLQVLLEKSRGRDKSIHRLARERLDELDKQRVARETLEKCCMDLEQLSEHHFSADGKVEQARLDRIVADWEQSTAKVDAPDKKLKASFDAAREAVNSQLARIAEQISKRTEIIDALHLHLSDKDGEPVAGLIKRWHDLDEPSPQQAREFTKLVAEVTEHDSQRDRDSHRVMAKEALLEKIEQAAGAKSVREGVLERLEQRWNAAPDPEDAAQKKDLGERFLALREKLRARLAKQQQEIEASVSKATALLDEYFAALEDGKLQIASSAHDKVASLLSRMQAPQQLKQPLAKRLRSAEPRMAELKRWRHWGTNKKREELCEAVEKLDIAAMKIPAVAKMVRESREAWKALDKSDGPSGRKLWKRFDTACEKAYAPCQAHFDQQKAVRQENRVKREAICAKLEALHGETDWDTPPWRELTDTLRETERAWHSAGSVDRRERNAIQSRYEKARAAIDSHLGTKRKEEIDRREALIAEVEKVTEQDDTGQAIEIAKRAQRVWKPVVQASRRKEQDLWKRFRAACDAVFEKRNEKFAAADKEREQNLAEKHAVCGQIEEIAKELKSHLDAETGTADVIAEARKKTRQLASGWQRIGQVPRNKQQSIEKQFKQGCNEVDKLCTQLDKLQKMKARQALRAVAEGCDELELAIAAGQTVEMSAIEHLKSQAKLPQAIVARLDRLQAAVGGDETALKTISDTLPANLETRLRLCLEIEIAANIDSPDAFKEDRMQYRVRMLSESMSGTRKPMSPAEIEQAWYDTGPVPEADRATLEQRFKRALEALGGD